MNKQLCKDRVVVITGAGRGIGREYALEFARHGAKVVVNDLGGRGDGGPGSATGPALEVVAEIEAMGGQAIANADDVADWAGAKRMIDAAIDAFGGLDVLVNNAGILRDRTLVNMEEEDWDAVIRVHMRGTFAPSRHAAAYWRNESKAGRQRDARIINTSSSSGLYCNAGQSNYGAAKAGIAALSVIASRELDRYGVTVNAIYPTAMSRLTEDIFASPKWQAIRNEAPGFDPLDPSNVAPLVAWLGSERIERHHRPRVRRARWPHHGGRRLARRSAHREDGALDGRGTRRPDPRPGEAGRAECVDDRRDSRSR